MKAMQECTPERKAQVYRKALRLFGSSLEVAKRFRVSEADVWNNLPCDEREDAA